MASPTPTATPVANPPTTTITIEGAVLQLQAELQATQKRAAQQAEHIQQLLAKMNQPSSISAAATGAQLIRSPTVTPAKPSTFDGDRRKTNPPVWLFELECYFEAAGVATDETRVKFAAAQLRAEASTWWMACVREHECNSWEQFKELFKANFFPIEASETARTALYNLKQHGSVTHYIASFRLHLHHVHDMSPADQLALFRKGLHESITWKLNIQHPKTLSEAIEWANRIEMENQFSRSTRLPQRHFGHPRSFHYNPTSNAYHFPSAPTSHFPSSNTAVPMEISQLESAGKQEDHQQMQQFAAQEQGFAQGQYGLLNAMQMHTRGGVHKQGQHHVVRGYATHGVSVSNAMFPPRLTPEERVKLFSENRCFRCRQVGHRNYECPLNTTAGSHSKNGHARR